MINFTQVVNAATFAFAGVGIKVQFTTGTGVGHGVGLDVGLKVGFSVIGLRVVGFRVGLNVVGVAVVGGTVGCTVTPPFTTSIIEHSSRRINRIFFSLEPTRFFFPYQ
jgi:hypothetical protein